MNASVDYTYSNPTISELENSLLKLQRPIFVIDSKTHTILSSNQKRNSYSRYDNYSGKQIKDVLLNYDTEDHRAPVFYVNTWYKVEEELFEFDGEELLIVTLNECAGIHSQENLQGIRSMITMLLHRFRSPLTAIGGYADILSTKSDESSSKLYANNIKKGTFSISTILDELEVLLQDNYKAEKEVIRFENFLEKITPVWREKSLAQRLRYSARKNGIIIGSSELLIKILTILIQNGFDHSIDPDSEVEIYVKSPYCIEVRSKGKAIKEEDYETIFNPFVTTRADKLGTGLTLARILAHKMNASIHLKSGEEGNVIFSINLAPLELALVN